MPAPSRSGFTLVELLVVIAVIAILAAVALPAITDSLIQSKGATAVNKLGEMAKATLAYSTANKDRMPLPAKEKGSLNPAFGDNSDDQADVWYNALASQLSVDPLSNLTSGAGKDGFYRTSSVFYLPGARYRKADLTSAPQFAFGMNLNLADWTRTGDRRLRSTGVAFPAKTVLFAEGGIAGERSPKSLVQDKGYTSSPSYRGPCAVEPQDYVARYKLNGVIAFGDNHVERIALDSVVTNDFSPLPKAEANYAWLPTGADLP
jgi:prepilin-type N-terminal cleavage/methylation domain-containing protein